MSVVGVGVGGDDDDDDGRRRRRRRGSAAAAGALPRLPALALARGEISLVGLLTRRAMPRKQLNIPRRTGSVKWCRLCDTRRGTILSSPLRVVTPLALARGEISLVGLLTRRVCCDTTSDGADRADRADRADSSIDI